MSLLQPTVLHLLSSLTGDSMSRPFVLTGSGRQLEVVSAIQLYSGCQKNVPIFKRFFYNRTTLYAAIPQFGTLL
jgi:hypothetical protein